MDVSRSQAWKDGSVEHAKPMRSAYSQPGVDDGAFDIRPHAAGGGWMANGRGAFTDILDERLVGLHRNAGREFVLDRGRHRVLVPEAGRAGADDDVVSFAGWRRSGC